MVEMVPFTTYKLIKITLYTFMKIDNNLTA